MNKQESMITAEEATDVELLAMFNARVDRVENHYAHIVFLDMYSAASWARSSGLEANTHIKTQPHSFADRVAVIVDLRDTYERMI